MKNPPYPLKIKEGGKEIITKKPTFGSILMDASQPPKRIILKKYSSVSQASLLLVALY